MNEFDLIALLTRSLPTNENVVTGAGDDCAVLDFGLPETLFLFKTDAVAEGVHFTKETPPGKIGHKALARCLSDIAAMAGLPNAAVVTVGLPEQFETEFIEKIYGGLGNLANKHGVAIVGGETTANPEAFSFPLRCWDRRAWKADSALRRKNRRRDFCDGRTGRLACRQTFEFRAAHSRGELARGTFSHPRDD